MTNSEKQERYRKKEALKKMAGEIAMRFSLRSLSYFCQGKNPAEFQKKLEDAVNLPSNWTDDDYNHALKCLQNLDLEGYDNPYLLENDITENHNSVDNFATTPNPAKYASDIKTAQADATKLVNHVLSAVELSGLSTADATAAILEVLRTLGRILMDAKKIPESNATSWALAAIGHQYEKPDWALGRFQKALGTQLGIEEAHKLGEELSNFRM